MTSSYFVLKQNQYSDRLSEVHFTQKLKQISWQFHPSSLEFPWRLTKQWSCGHVRWLLPYGFIAKWQELLVLLCRHLVQSNGNRQYAISLTFGMVLMFTFISPCRWLQQPQFNGCGRKMTLITSYITFGWRQRLSIQQLSGVKFNRQNSWLCLSHSVRWGLDLVSSQAWFPVDFVPQ